MVSVRESALGMLHHRASEHRDAIMCPMLCSLLMIHTTHLKNP